MAVRLLLTLATFFVAMPLLAQDTDSIVPERAVLDRLPVETEVRLGGVYFSNFGQAPPGNPQDNILGATSEVTLAYALTAAGGIHAYSRLRGTVYDRFDPSAGLEGGLRWTEGTQSFDGNVGYLWHSPRFDVGERTTFADVIYSNATYTVRMPNAVQVSGTVSVAGFYMEPNSEALSRNNRIFDVGLSTRYHGFGYLFSPEIGADLGGRAAVREVEDYRQRSLWLVVRMIPTPPLWISVRYRNRQLNYTTNNTEVSNFQRSDSRHQATFNTALDVTSNLKWIVYYSYEDASSTVPWRNFSTWFLTSGLSYRIQ